MTETELLRLRVELAAELGELVASRLQQHDAQAAARHREVAKAVVEGVGELLCKTLAEPIARLDKRIRELEDRNDRPW